MNNIYLIGMMGCGKTTVGIKLADKLHLNFFDLDAVIEKQAEMSIPEIFQQFGEAYFRKLEQRGLLKVSKQSNSVVSCGGGIVLNQENIDVMRNTGTIVYINRSIDTIIKNVDHSQRPLLKNAEHKAKEIFKQRKALYEKSCDFMVNNNTTVEDAVLEIMQKIERNYIN